MWNDHLICFFPPEMISNAVALHRRSALCFSDMLETAFVGDGDSKNI